MAGRRWAMLVGASAYEFFRPLKYSASDAADFARSLWEDLGFTEETTLLLTDVEEHEPYHNPTRSAIIHSLCLLENEDSKLYRDRQVAPITEDDLFVFYFSGHGVRTPEGEEFLLSMDASDQAVTDTALDIDDLMRRIENLPCRHKILFIDACRAELDDDDGAKTPDLPPGVGAKKLARPGFATFYSCDPKGRSYEIDDEDIRHGSFTYCLLQAVKDSKVKTLAELNNYLLSRVPSLNAARNKRPQQPFFVPNPLDMASLELFTFQERLDLSELMQGTTKLVEDDVIDIEWWEKIGSFLQEVERGQAADVVLRMKILNDLLQGTTSFERFRGRWALTERFTRSVREAKPQVMGPPNG